MKKRYILGFVLGIIIYVILHLFFNIAPLLQMGGK